MFTVYVLCRNHVNAFRVSRKDRKVFAALGHNASFISFSIICQYSFLSQLKLAKAVFCQGLNSMRMWNQTVISQSWAACFLCPSKGKATCIPHVHIRGNQLRSETWNLLVTYLMPHNSDKKAKPRDCSICVWCPGLTVGPKNMIIYSNKILWCKSLPTVIKHGVR